jgi:hypothetical protein
MALAILKIRLVVANTGGVLWHMNRGGIAFCSALKEAARRRGVEGSAIVAARLHLGHQLLQVVVEVA